MDALSILQSSLTARSLVTSLLRYNFDAPGTTSYNTNLIAELCSGSTGDFGSLSPGSNPGSAASLFLKLSPTPLVPGIAGEEHIP